jgi:hypothetical protein
MNRADDRDERIYEEMNAADDSDGRMLNDASAGDGPAKPSQN